MDCTLGMRVLAGSAADAERAGGASDPGFGAGLADLGSARLAHQLRRRSMAAGRWPRDHLPSAARTGLQTRWERLAVLEAHSAQSGGIAHRAHPAAVAGRPAARWEARSGRKPGELVCLDTFYIGKLKGVGKVWQLTACDAASSFAVAEITLDFSANATAHFLAKRVVPRFRQGGLAGATGAHRPGQRIPWRLRPAASELGIRHTRTQPRHAWTNGFVERLQGTILNELWRIEFSRAGSSPGSPPCRSLWIATLTSTTSAIRPHQGYRTKGRTPGQVLAQGRSNHASRIMNEKCQHLSGTGQSRKAAQWDRTPSITVPVQHLSHRQIKSGVFPQPARESRCAW